MKFVRVQASPYETALKTASKKGIDLNLNRKKIKNLDLSELTWLIKTASNIYYNTDKELVPDPVYDALEEELRTREPKHSLLKKVGAPTIRRGKVKLPYVMPSLSKIKPGEKSFTAWMAKNKGPYLVSDKMDGLSMLLVGNKDGWQIFTRGDGTKGQDISTFAQYLDLPKPANVTVRAEIELDNAKFKQFEKEAENPRSFVSGLINSNNPSTKLKHCDIFAYEVIKPSRIKPSEQFAKLKKLGFKVPFHKVVSSIDPKKLSVYLDKRRSTSKHTIDGLVITQDEPYTRTTADRPKYSVAFKKDNADMQSTVEVVEVIWEPSKHGYLKPRIRIKPVRLGGATISYCTGHNAKFIKDNKIGPGAKLNIVRSGEIIPYVQEVVKPTKAQMPDMDYEWTDSKVDIFIVGHNDTVEVKKLSQFLTLIGVEGVKQGLVAKLYDSGITSIPKLVKATEKRLLKIDGIQEKTAKKIVSQIEEKLKSATLGQLMAASGCFDRTLGTKRLEAISKTPNLMTDKSISLLPKITSMSGFSSNTAKSFIKGLAKFKALIKELGVNPTPSKDKNVKKGPLTGKSFCFTGFRNKQSEEMIEDLGGEIKSAVTANLTYLVVKDKQFTSSKVQKAITLGVKILDEKELLTKLNKL